ncbi:MAG: PSD1 domain-containing protein [Planctomycetaceae bacterium]|nr:PSD1 domain-containing protein [Planctomycetaceae bacterium]
MLPLRRGTAGPGSEHEQFFERQVRPILVSQCSECHGDLKQEAGLRLNSREALLQGGDSGPAIQEERWEDSLLLRVISYDGNIQMPPDQKLSDEEIARLTAWVRNGAVMPAGPKPSSTALGYAATAEGLAEARSSHWAYQPVQKTVPPVTRVHTWAENPVDRFIQAAQEAAGIAPNPAADRRTLLRRVKFDLLGLPPTIDEVREFESCTALDAWGQQIERLLASPHYGERWGRHWLDLVRYADTKGYVFLEERRYPYAYTYRDYVIDALNRDVPFDRFVLEQLAADQLDGDKSSLAAMGFLTVGRRFANNKHDIIDDRIDVVSRGLLALTVGCARCHDHKYDAVPTDDYYSLYGVFASSTEPDSLPQLSEPADTNAFRAYREEHARRQGIVDQFVAECIFDYQNELRSRCGDYLRALVLPEAERSQLDVKSQIVRRWSTYFEANSDVRDRIWGPWHELLALPADEFAAAAPTVIAALSESRGGTAQANTWVTQALQSHVIVTPADVARVYGELLAGVHSEWIQLSGTGVLELPDLEREALRQVLYSETSPISLPSDELRRLLGRDKRNRIKELERDVAAYEATSPGAPPRAMVLLDATRPSSPRVFVRGNPGREGKEVPRRFLQVLKPGAQPFQQGSGRLELARAIVDPDNPLTARVIVNRVWQHHFGHGLVRTPSDFGVRGEGPSHPELLDWLSAELIRNEWSLKWLHRTLLRSATYQQTSTERRELAAMDPDNRLLGRMNPRRLEFEPLRDALLAVATQLDDRMTGHPVDLFAAPDSDRRTVYGFIDRQDLPSTLRIFDFATPDVSVAERAETTVPQQLLFQMNAPMAIDRSKKLAAVVQAESQGDAAAAVSRLYQRVYARLPKPDELQAAEQFLQSECDVTVISPTPDQQSRLEQLAQALLLANEFIFLD